MTKNIKNKRLKSEKYCFDIRPKFHDVNFDVSIEKVKKFTLHWGYYNSSHLIKFTIHWGYHNSAQNHFWTSCCNSSFIKKILVDNYSVIWFFSIMGPMVIFFGPFIFIYLVILFRSNGPFSLFLVILFWKKKFGSLSVSLSLTLTHFLFNSLFVSFF